MSVDLGGLTPAELASQWERTLQVGQRLFEIHLLIVNPAYLAVSEFDELYRTLFETSDPHESYRLLREPTCWLPASGSIQRPCR